jgi:type II restriction enzyme
MSTDRQTWGNRGVALVVRRCKCPRCKRKATLKRLPANFKCADVICDFCGYLGQVKTKALTKIPSMLAGAAWIPQKERMDAGIYFPLFLVLVGQPNRPVIYYLSADVQSPVMFRPRRPLPVNARRSGWQGVIYNFASVRSAFVRVWPEDPNFLAARDALRPPKTLA